jgi:hypothetical protein
MTDNRRGPDALLHRVTCKILELLTVGKEKQHSIPTSEREIGYSRVLKFGTQSVFGKSLHTEFIVYFQIRSRYANLNAQVLVTLSST